jgi:hypothetical protein
VGETPVTLQHSRKGASDRNQKSRQERSEQPEETLMGGFGTSRTRGSKRYLGDEETLEAAIQYVLEGQ